MGCHVDRSWDVRYVMESIQKAGASASLVVVPLRRDVKHQGLWDVRFEIENIQKTWTDALLVVVLKNNVVPELAVIVDTQRIQSYFVDTKRSQRSQAVHGQMAVVKVEGLHRKEQMVRKQTDMLDGIGIFPSYAVTCLWLCWSCRERGNVQSPVCRNTTISWQWLHNGQRKRTTHACKEGNRSENYYRIII